MNKELYDEAVRSNVLSKALISTLLESMNYSSISFINWTVEVLKVIRTRLERGDKIIDEVSGITYDLNSFLSYCKYLVYLLQEGVQEVTVLLKSLLPYYFLDHFRACYYWQGCYRRR